jgi:capsular exopolysaccharide synthesis family protein
MLGDNEGRPRLTHQQAGVPQRRATDALDIWHPDREEIAIDLAQYWRLLLKHKYVIIGVFIGSILLGVGATLLMTPIYTASATLQIDREAARVLDTEDVAPRESLMQGEEFFQTQYGLLGSRSLAQRVVEAQGLAVNDDFLKTMGRALPESAEGRSTTAAERAEAVLRAVQDNLGVQPVRGSRLVGVSFDSPDPRLSARIANAFAENFIQSNLERKFESSSYARAFLEERLAQTKATLEEAERNLVAYATEQQIITVAEPSAGDGSTRSLAATDLAALNAALATARAARVSAEERWRQASVSSLMSLPEVLQNPAIQRLTESRAALNAAYQQKLTLYRPEFPEMVQLKAQIDELDSQIQTIATEIRTSIRQRYAVAANEERSLEARVNALKGDVLDFRDRSIQYNILQREVDTSRSLYDGLLQRYKEVGVAGGITANNISIIDRAEPPRLPSQPRLVLNVALAALAGLGLGVLIAFALELLDETIATPDDVEAKLGVPVLGVVPALNRGVSPIEGLSDIRSGFAEAYYSLRTALQFSTNSGAPDSIFITSSRPGEGKSTTALAIAHNFARIGRRVLLLDLDLRKPSMHRLLQMPNDRGMSNFLSGAATLQEVVQDLGDPNLWFVSAGPLPPNPAELLAGGNIQTFLKESRARFDMVVIDGPPVLGFADAPVLAASVGGTLFVVEARQTKRGQARGALRRLQMGDAHILGALLTKFSAKAAHYGGYDYAYDYNYGAAPSAKTPSEP